MNLAGDSNITDLPTEERVRKLVNEYVFNSDSEYYHLSDSDDLVWAMTAPASAFDPGSVNAPGSRYSSCRPPDLPPFGKKTRKIFMLGKYSNILSAGDTE